MDYKCDECTFRVNGAGEGREMFERHVATAHPKPERKLGPKKVDRVYGDAVPEVVKDESE